MVQLKSSSDTDDHGASADAAVTSATTRTPSPDSSQSDSPVNPIFRMPFRYNPLHDLESLWWMSLYFAAGRVVVDDGTGHTWSEEEEAAQINMQLESFPRLFCDPLFRLQIMSGNRRFVEETQALHPSVSCFRRPLDSSRASLSAAFRWVEQDIQTREFAPPISVYNGLRQGWFAIAKHLMLQDIVVKPLPLE